MGGWRFIYLFVCQRIPIGGKGSLEGPVELCLLIMSVESRVGFLFKVISVYYFFIAVCGGVG